MGEVKKVLVVGAGIGGLGATAALAQRGIDVDVIEIRPHSTVFGVGINQPGNSLRALRAIGVLDDVIAAGYEFDGWRFKDYKDNLIVDVPSGIGDEDTPANIALTRRDLHDILIGAVKRAGVEVRYGVTAEELDDRGDSVHATFSDGSSGDYDLVVGFDGIKSGIRRQLFGDTHKPVYTGYAVWRVTVPRSGPPRLSGIYQGINAKGGYIPLNERQMYLFLVTPEPQDERYEKEQLADLLRDRLAQFDGIPAEVREQLGPHSEVVYSPLSEVLLPEPWHRGRIVVAGDAAHACSPHITQGAGMALEDGVVLADELEADRPVEEALVAFAARRHPRAKLVQDVSRGILDAEMRVVSDEALGHAAEHMAAELPGQMGGVDAILRQPA
jgi:2-polyprenyl-6-methoxyphenol hydroxylase-like FAD-dependent oxidoreductase